MTEHDLPDAERERLARRAVWDYLSVGPEPDLGAIEIEALDDWIETASIGPERLRPQDVTNLAWMHVERAWGRVATADLLAQPVPDDIADLVRTDLTEASDLFGIAQAKATSSLQAHARIAQLSVPIFRLALLGSDKEVVHKQMAHYMLSQHEAIAAIHHGYKKTGDIHSVLFLNQLIGLRLATAQSLHTAYLALPAPYRHSNSGGSPYHQWHVAVFDRRSGTTHKVAFAPEGPPGVVLFSTELLLHIPYPKWPWHCRSNASHRRMA